MIQDCEAALKEEEFALACSTEGATLPMIYFEARELPDEETPTPAYLNWIAQRIAEIQLGTDSRRRRKTEPVSVVLPEVKFDSPPEARGLLRCVTNEPCVMEGPAPAPPDEDVEEEKAPESSARPARPSRVRRPSPHPVVEARRRHFRARNGFSTQAAEISKECPFSTAES